MPDTQPPPQQPTPPVPDQQPTPVAALAQPPLPPQTPPKKPASHFRILAPVLMLLLYILGIISGVLLYITYPKMITKNQPTPTPTQKPIQPTPTPKAEPTLEASPSADLTTTPTSPLLETPSLPIELSPTILPTL